ncbi:MAG: ribosomal RNA small subunit methyltransferase A [Mollicutes bacterium]|nr:ribosomal RNA small subunit methyltransferase A [Mollicutes bacterium]
MNKFNFKKKYGQNFLIDKNVLSKIIENIKADKDDLIIEIGMGSGNLTKELVKFGCPVLGYEIDLDTKKYLDEIKSSNLEIIYEDFLNRNIKKDIEKFQYQKIYIVGNLPYYITTPIIEKITKENLNPKEILIMVQKEVAERFSAIPKTKNYGYITVYLNYYYQVTKLFNVSRNSFIPAPKVESSVIKFIAHNKYKISDETKFIKLISDAFKQKRKTLLNNLYNYDKEIIEAILVKHNYSNLVRAEELPIEIFLEITNAL